MKSINIFGQEIPVSYKEELISIHGTGAYYNTQTKEIVIDSRLEGEELMQVLLHELGHAMFDRLGWDQSIAPQMEESIVQSYSKMITELFTIKFKAKKRVKK